VYESFIWINFGDSVTLGCDNVSAGEYLYLSETGPPVPVEAKVGGCPGGFLTCSNPVQKAVGWVQTNQPVRSCVSSVVSRRPVRSIGRRLFSFRPFARVRGCCR